MADGGTLGVNRVCCLLHNLLPGGSARQWISLLACHVQAGGQATILAPAGPLSMQAGAAGIDLVDVAWGELPKLGQGTWPLVARHDAAIVHWDHEVMNAFAPALAACGRAALTVHQAPRALSRWLGGEAIHPARAILEEALAEKQAVLVRGEWHRRRFVEAFDLPTRDLRILPASIPMPPPAPAAATEPPREVLALMRLSPDKAAIAQLAVALVSARLEQGERCRLTIAGDGHWRTGTADICRRGLPTGAWRFEPPPSDPIDRLGTADLVVAQGLTTLEAAALGRRTVVARSVDAERAAGVVLTPARYDAAARDPFGQPETSEDTALLWREILALDQEDLDDLRDLVQHHNSLEVTSGALGEALRATAPRSDPESSP